MKKLEFMTPEMEVIEIKSMDALLIGSGEEPGIGGEAGEGEEDEPA